MTHAGTWTFDDTIIPIPRILLRPPDPEDSAPASLTPGVSPGNATPTNNEASNLVQLLLAALTPFPEARLAVTHLLLRLARETPP